jgi:hypothetical protein
MRKLFAVLLFGVLSMFFAEVFSGASTLWFLNAWGIFVTLPLYLGHALFFFNLAVWTKRTLPRQLYFFGMLFGLYEALITKVLWYGYPNSSGPMVGYFFGVAWGEFLTLVLFWHPIMSFIVPILTFEVLSGEYLNNHEWLLQRNRRTLLLVTVLVIAGAVFQSNGAQYNVLVSLGSIAGTVLIIGLLHYLSTGKNIQSLLLGRKGMILLVTCLIALYSATTFLILPERLPNTIPPYLLILIWYLFMVCLLFIDKPLVKSKAFETPVITVRQLSLFLFPLLGATALFSFTPSASYVILVIFFISLIGLGVLLFSFSLLQLVNQKIKNRLP